MLTITKAAREPISFSLKFSAKRPKQSFLHSRPTNLNNRKYADRRYTGIIKRQNHECVIKIQVSNVYLLLKFDEIQNDFLIKHWYFQLELLAEKSKFLLENIELTHLF